LVTSTFDPTTGLWSASGALNDVNTLLANLTFTPAANYNGNFTIATSVDDGVALPITGVKNVTGIAVDDSPTATNLNTAETYVEDTPFHLTPIVISDVDSTTVTATLTLSDVGAGTLNTGTSGSVTSTYDSTSGIWQAGGAIADVNTLLANLTFTPTANYNSNFSIGITLDDGFAAPTTGAKSMIGTAVDDAPSATNLNAAETYTEDTPIVLTPIVASDIDSFNITATLTLSDTSAGTLGTATSGSVTSTYDPTTGIWRASGAIADVNVLLTNVTFTPAANYNNNFTIATSVDDGIAAPITGMKAVTGIAVNDPSTVTGLNAAEIYTEDNSLTLTNIVISDVDSANVTARLTLADPAAGSLTTDTSGLVTSTYAASTGIWQASGAIADVNALLANLTFVPAANYHSNFTIATSVDDGVAAPITGVKNMTGVAVDDAPVATNLNTPETYTEDTPFNLTPIVVSDADSAMVTATLTLSDSGAGSLSIATAGSVASTYDATTGIWQASGAIADVNTLLANLTFVPAANYNSNFTIATSVDDGVAAATIGVKSLTAVPVNDAPVASNLNAPETYTEGIPLNLTPIFLSDIDSAAVTATLTLSDRTAGSFSTATSGSVTSTYDSAAGTWRAGGPIADVNGLLAHLTFSPAANYSSNFTIATRVDDGTTAINGVKNITGVAVIPSPTIQFADSSSSSTPEPVQTAPAPTVSTTISAVSVSPGTPNAVAAVLAPATPAANSSNPSNGSNGSDTSSSLPTATSVSSDGQSSANVTAAPIPVVATANTPTPSRLLPEPAKPASDSHLAVPVQNESASSPVDSDQQDTKISALPDLASIVDIRGFVEGLNELRDEVHEDVHFDKVTVGSTAAVTTGFSIGYVLWLLRGEVLLSSLLASLPAWRIIDPLPVLASLNTSSDKDEEADDSIESVVKKGIGTAASNQDRKQVHGSQSIKWRVITQASDSIPEPKS
jgi:hypothetical protein